MMREFRTALDVLRSDSSARVIVFSSADPEFFLAHVDMRIGERTDVLEQLAGKARGGGAEFVAVSRCCGHRGQRGDGRKHGGDARAPAETLPARTRGTIETNGT